VIAALVSISKRAQRAWRASHGPGISERKTREFNTQTEQRDLGPIAQQIWNKSKRPKEQERGGGGGRGTWRVLRIGGLVFIGGNSCNWPRDRIPPWGKKGGGGLGEAHPSQNSKREKVGG